MRYSIFDSVGSNGGGSVFDSTRYTGTLTFFMKDEGSGWGLYAWNDNRSAEPDARSWSRLRGVTRPQ